MAYLTYLSLEISVSIEDPEFSNKLCLKDNHAMISELESENLPIKVLSISFEHIKQLDNALKRKMYQHKIRREIYISFLSKAKIGIETTTKC